MKDISRQNVDSATWLLVSFDKMEESDELKKNHAGFEQHLEETGLSFYSTNSFQNKKWLQGKDQIQGFLNKALSQGIDLKGVGSRTPPTPFWEVGFKSVTGKVSKAVPYKTFQLYKKPLGNWKPLSQNTLILSPR